MTAVKPLIIVGASARAAAQSARRAKFEPYCVDLFTDRDLQAIAHARRCPPERYPIGLLDKLWQQPAHAPVLLTGAMDQHPAVVAAIAANKPLMGCQPDQIAALRDPHVWQDAPDHPGIGYPQVFTALPTRLVAGRFMWKPSDTTRQSGDRVREWAHETALTRGYLQQYVAGQDFGVVYHSKGGQVALLGMTQQLVGDAHLLAAPAQYAGSVGPLPLDEPTRDALLHLGNWLAGRSLVQGLFGIDVRQTRDGRFWPLEINPRYTASVEIIERVMQIAALTPPPQMPPLLHQPGRMLAKGIIYSDRAMPAPPVMDWFEPDELADIPQPWRRIHVGAPICTLFARGEHADACIQRLYAMADELYTRIEQWSPL